MTRRSLIALMLAVLPGGVINAAEVIAPIGAKIDRLTFKDIRYLNRSLDDFPRGKVFVFVTLDTGCPLVQRYLPTLKKFDEDYRARGVHLIGLNAGAGDSIPAMAAQAVRHGLEFPVVKDLDGSCAKALGLSRTPEVAVLDAERKLRYRGRIDDQYRHGGARRAPENQDLRAALDAVLDGKTVANPESPVDGCPITWPEPAKPRVGVTFSEQIAPILKQHCQECHRPNAVAPFALMKYDDIKSRAKAIAEVITDGRMPPWYAAPDHTGFANKRGLSGDERETLLAWLKSDMPRGDDSKLPVPLPPADAWRMGEPDLVVSAPEHDIPATGDLPYQYALLPHLFLADTWVQGVQIRPDNPRMVHHCNMAFVKLGDKFSIDNFITGQVPGGEPMTLDNGAAVKLPAGSLLILQIHYVATGRPEKCKISVGLRYPRETVQQQLRHVMLVNTRYAIPPYAPAYPVSAAKTLNCDAVGIGLFAHMHVRGKDISFRAKTPDGKTSELLLVPNYSFDCQMPYRWAPGRMKLPKGTRLECVAHYDNSAFNPYNPDPAATVRDGPQTYQEMLNGFVFYVDANEKLNLSIDPKTGRVTQ